MFTHISSNWPLFCIAFGVMLFLRLIMSWQSVHFYTKDVILRRFSIMELELPSTPTELVNLIKGLYKLPDKQSVQAVKALKGQLYLDFLFMPFAYGAILLLCTLVSRKMNLTFGINIFMIFAFLQPVAWLCDIIENIYLLRKIRPDVEASTPAVHKAYLFMECIKWGIALISIISSVSAIFYFWLTGHYTLGSLRYLGIIAAEIAVFVAVSKIFIKKSVVV
jgi:hypothetical protein